MGKSLRESVEREPTSKPWPADRNFRWIDLHYDRSTHRIQENSKLIVVEGAHAVGKSKFAKELAEDLDMRYIPFPRMDDFYINCYGVDLRKYNDAWLPIQKPYDEKDFSRNPLGPVEGCTDRLMCYLHKLKFTNHVKALGHILNTGQGVVMEGTPYTDHIYLNAVYKQGWIDKSTYNYVRLYQERVNRSLMKPNLYIYLDAPIDVVQKKIMARNNEWDKDSPVWTNKRYLADIYGGLKNYLKEAGKSSYVLMYDWSEPGDFEVVIEDIEQLNFDYLAQYDEQQKDWRLLDERGYNEKRYKYCNQKMKMEELAIMNSDPDNFDHVHLIMETEELEHLDWILNWSESMRYEVGCNTLAGDKWTDIAFIFNEKRALWRAQEKQIDQLYPHSGNTITQPLKFGF